MTGHVILKPIWRNLATKALTSIHLVRKEPQYEKKWCCQVNGQHPLPGLLAELCDVRHALEPCDTRQQIMRRQYQRSGFKRMQN